jgi:NAD(P)-dependent dehydrogenase (short-subunit alcohol dehydrogenase family)
MAEQASGGANRPVLVVTGASRGIGAAIARLAAGRGHDLVLTWLNGAAEIEQVAAKCRAAGARVLAHRADLSDPAAAGPLFAAVDAEFGRLDGLVNNAGITGPAGRFLDSTDATWEAVFRANVLGLVACTREAAQRMSTQRGGRGGAIVNISSRASQLGGANTWVHYAASKGAVDTLTIGLAQELGAEGVRVNAVNPGIINTEIHARAGFPDRVRQAGGATPLGRAGEPEEVAEMVLWLLSPAASYVSGACLPVSGAR